MMLLLTMAVIASTLSADGIAVGEPEVTLYVSSSAGAGGDGTSQNPFDSLERARDAIRARRQDGSLPDGGVVVDVLPGRYERSTPFELSAQDSGTPAAPIAYRSVAPGQAILTGTVSLSGWRPVTDLAVRSRLDPDSRAHVVWADLPQAVPDPVPGFANGGCGYRGKPEYPIALFQKGKRLPISRWPNGAFAKMGECVGHHEKRGHVGTTYTDGVFVFDNDRLERWVGEPDAWFDGLWFHHWADQKMRLKQIDLKARTIALADPESHSFGYKTGQQFFSFNLISEIDQPGEWAVDRKSRRLYLWPERALAKTPIQLSATDRLISSKDLKHVSFEGFVLEGCRETAVLARDCESLTISGCTLRHIGSWGVDIGGGRDCTVIGCDLYDLGQGGIRASGGVRDTLEPGNHLIENNHIHHFGQIVSTYQPGAAVYGVGNKIRHNLIYQAQHQAVYFRGNDHLIEYNIVHDVCLHSSDAGAIYACARDWSRRGTIIRHNLFHALGEGLDGTGCRAIYLDDMTSGTIVQSNIVTMGDHGLNFGGGQDNLIADNIAVNCKRSVNLASRGIDSFARKNAERGKESTQFKLLLRDESLFRNELWSKRYPKLLAPLEMDPIDAQNAHFNTIRRNVNVGGGPLGISNSKKVMRTCTVEDNIDLFEDPGFTDLSSLDLCLRSDAPIYAELPDFQAPDFQPMGLYKDPRRASPAVKFGPHVSPLAPIMSPEARSKAERPLLVSVPPAVGAIKIDGLLEASEWDAEDSEQTAVLTAVRDPTQKPCPSRVWLCTDKTHLFVAFEHTIDAGQTASTGENWGRDDGVEIVLGPARDERLPNRLEGIILRGYANGTLEIAEGSQPVPAASDGGEAIAYAADHSEKGRWTAEFGIPLAVIGLDPTGRLGRQPNASCRSVDNGPLPLVADAVKKSTIFGISGTESNYPVYCHVTVRKPAGNQWITWRERWSHDPSNAKCACALSLDQFGPIPFMPGFPTSAIRIDLQGNREAKSPSMKAGDGASAPDWAVKWNRLVTTFGTARADRWTSCRFEFTPLEDTTVSLELMGTQSLPGGVLAWTHYDDFRVEGADLINGDFEEPKQDGRIPGWNSLLLSTTDVLSRVQGAVVELGEEAASGRRAAMVSHDHRVSQRIDIKKGRKVVVRFQARAAMPGM